MHFERPQAVAIEQQQAVAGADARRQSGGEGADPRAEFPVR
jgi:hypothetical protein